MSFHLSPQVGNKVSKIKAGFAAFGKNFRAVELVVFTLVCVVNKADIWLITILWTLMGNFGI